MPAAKFCDSHVYDNTQGETIWCARFPGHIGIHVCTVLEERGDKPMSDEEAQEILERGGVHLLACTYLRGNWQRKGQASALTRGSTREVEPGPDDRANPPTLQSDYPRKAKKLAGAAWT